MSAPWYDLRITRGMTAQLTNWHQRLKAGEKAIGWKVGFGAPAAMEKLKIAAPLIGNLTDKARLDSESKVSIAGWTKAAAEPEIAVFMSKDLPGGANRDVAKNAIAGIAPAIELADVEFPPDDVEAILKGNIYQRHVILGPCDKTRARCELSGLTAVVRICSACARNASAEIRSSSETWRCSSATVSPLPCESGGPGMSMETILALWSSDVDLRLAGLYPTQWQRQARYHTKPATCVYSAAWC